MRTAGLTSSTSHRRRSFFLVGAVATLLIPLVAACGGKSGVPEATSTAAPTSAPGTVVTMYASPT